MFQRDSESTEPDAARQRQMLIAAVGAILLVVVLGVVFLVPAIFGGSGSEATAAPVIPHRAKATPSAAPSVAATPTPAPAPVLINQNVRDPFAQLPQEIVASTAASATTPATASTTTTEGAVTSTGSTTTATSTATAPTASSTTASTAPTAATATTGSSTASTAGTAAPGTGPSQVAGKPVQYMSFAGGGSAKVEIDSTPYTMSAGQMVAGYRIVSVSSGSVQVAHGSVTKTLALGELQTF